MIRTYSFLLPIAVCYAALAALPAHAEKADREKPVSFASDEGEVNYEKRTGILKGNVVITQGTLTIKANRIDFKQNADNSMSATAYGNPVRFREKRDGADDYYEGYAQRIVYDGEKRFIELFENALLKKTGDEIRSNYITYSAATEKFTAEGRPDAKPPAAGETPLGARVRGTFQPKSEDKGDKPAAKDSAAASKDPAPSSKDKSDVAKDKHKSAATKDKGAAAKTAVPLTLQPSGDLAPAK